jgi:hypothetical protein
LDIAKADIGSEPANQIRLLVTERGFPDEVATGVPGPRHDFVQYTVEDLTVPVVDADYLLKLALPAPQQLADTWDPCGQPR